MHPVFRILGPLEVELSDEHVVALGRRERALLGVLLLNAGEVVSVERLIDGVWGEAPPSSAKHMVHEYVSRLRTALGDASRIQTRVPGYLVICSDEELDTRLFSQFAATARAAASADEHAVALRVYEQALGLWRGDALAGVELEGAAQIDAARLDQERRSVAEERVDSALALGRHRELIPELERRVSEEPLRERSRAQLMLALYRAGRQIEALECYREGRALLVDHAGVEPGRELRELERDILTQDPALDLAPAMRGDERSASSTQARRHRVRVAILSGVLLAAAVSALVFVLGQSDSAQALARIDASSAGAIDPSNNRLVDQVRVGAGPGPMATGFGSLWVVNEFDDTVSRIDPASGMVLQVIPVHGDPTAIAVGADFVWVTCSATRSVDRIDPRVNRRTQTVRVGNGPSGIALSPGAVWVTNRLDDNVTEIDARSGHVRGAHDAGPSPSAVAYGLGALWIANESSSKVTRLDPATGGIEAVIPVGNGPEAVAVGNGAVWVANSLDGTVWRIDPRRDAVASVIAVGSGPSSVLADDGAIWVADSYDRRVVRIDPATNLITSKIDVGSGPQSLASIGGRVWLSTRETASVHRGGTLRVSDFAGIDSADSGMNESGVGWSVFSATGDGLVAFKRVSGIDGGTLVPDLATSVPRATGGDRIYTFHLRRGIHYSNGVPVRASDLRRALERAFRFEAAQGYFDALIGGSSCTKSHCDLSRGVVSNDQTGTVILRLRRPDPELLDKLALPLAQLVPPGVSMTRPAPLGVPGTGPYVVQSFKPKLLLVLRRNPRFRRWSDAAQPDGYPDKIILTFKTARSAQVTAVEHGESDLMRSPPSQRLDELETRYAAQIHVFPAAQTFGIFLNTRMPPFSSRAARKAFNYAIDRVKAIPGFGGVAGATVTCQILPVGTSAYRPYCPYTRNPTRAGIWKGPDLALANKLVDASGTRGQQVVLWTGSRPFQLALGHLAHDTLVQLGYRAKLRIIADPDAYFSRVYDFRTRAQAGFIAWGADYPSASNFLAPQFSCSEAPPASQGSVNAAQLCSQRLDKAVDHALSGQTTDKGAVAEEWMAIDRMVTDIAPWAPIVNGRIVVFVSRRVGNVQANEALGVLLDQIWVR